MDFRKERKDPELEQQLLQSFIQLCLRLYDRNQPSVTTLTQKLVIAECRLQDKAASRDLLLYLESILLGISHDNHECRKLIKLHELYRAGKALDAKLKRPIQDYCQRQWKRKVDERYSDIDRIIRSLHEERDFEPFDVRYSDDVGEDQDQANSALYKSLVKHAQCTCSKSSPHRRHVGSLELSGLALTGTLNPDIWYKAAFKHCVSTSQNGAGWARLQFKVSRAHSRATPERRGVKFAHGTIGEPTPGTTASGSTGGVNHETTDLCRMLRISAGLGCVHVGVIVSPGYQLLDPVDAQLAQYELAPEDGKSLAEVLQEHKLSDVGKIHLAHILASAVWLYYQSDWMRRRWTINDIHFIRSQWDASDAVPGPETLDPLTPFIEMRFEENDAEQRAEDLEYLKDYNAHHAPRILALGVMLVSIFWGPVKQATAGDHRFMLNRELSTCDTKLRESLPLDLYDEELQHTLQKAIEACFKTEELNKETSTLEERRMYLYKNVVRPIHRLLQVAGWNRELAKWVLRESVATEFERSTEGELQRDGVQLDPSCQDYDQERTAGAMSSRTDMTPEKWIDDITGSTLSRAIGDFDFPKTGLTRIKIAILDTGYDPNCVFFDMGRRKRIKWKDFATPASTKPSDTSSDGHGTFVLSLAMIMAPKADFYVARIAANSDGLCGKTPTAVLPITRAIQWAVKEGVDIISMSFGFDLPQSPIQTVISQIASDSQHPVLLFAAASNAGGNTGQEDFPARLPNVFAIHASDHLANLANFDMKYSTKGPDFFATLGKDIAAHVPVAMASSDGRTRKSGTSFATPIAACIAALVLFAAKLSDNGGERYAALKRFEVMKRMFKCEEMGRIQPTGYHYLQPMGFFKEDERRRRQILDYVVHLQGPQNPARSAEPIAQPVEGSRCTPPCMV